MAAAIATADARVYLIRNSIVQELYWIGVRSRLYISSL